MSEEKFDKKKGKPQPKPKEQKILSPSGKEIKGVVRLAGKDLKGTLTIQRVLTTIKGVGINLSKVLADIAYSHLKINENTYLGELSDEQIESLEDIIFHPEKFGVPSFMFNRRKDLMSGKDMHLIGSDLVYAVKQDIEHEKEINSWRGFRHTYGQKVRGQRTRSTGRTGMTVGVIRKSLAAKGASSAQQAQQQQSKEKENKQAK
jgi:small subunit ribosomal protein S13